MIKNNGETTFNIAQRREEAVEEPQLDRPTSATDSTGHASPHDISVASVTIEATHE
ncbi:hypothetical protein AB205_0141740, partial [Aquarana catesbeiana]